MSEAPRNDPTAGLFDFDNRYAQLGESFYARLVPTPVPSPRLLRLNVELAEELGLDPERLASETGVEVLAGNRVPAGAEPLAQAYAGHQFGNFVPQLGDGRALLLGEVLHRDGRHRDIQLKGSGKTPFSRGGDGRAPLGPVLREYLISEAMHALGIPTTRSLAAVATGDVVMRDAPLPGGVLTRVATSHVRVGTLQYFAVRGDDNSVKEMVDFVIDRHYPQVRAASDPAVELLREIMKRQASLVARWLGIGFIHGVMNTDNTTLSGETVDFGPCAFMDTFDPSTVFSSIDRHGRYAYSEQPKIIAWNMARLAEAMLPALDENPEIAVAKAQEIASEFPACYESAWLTVMRAKLGLQKAEADDAALISMLLDAMTTGEADFTNAFRDLCEAAVEPKADEAVRAHFKDPAAYDSWATRWRQRLATDGDEAGRRERMRKANPAFIPRNHRVETALDAAVTDGDLGPFEALLAVLQQPYDDQPESSSFRQPPEAGRGTYRTFCGT